MKKYLDQLVEEVGCMVLILFMVLGCLLGSLVSMGIIADLMKLVK